MKKEIKKSVTSLLVHFEKNIRGKYRLFETFTCFESVEKKSNFYYIKKLVLVNIFLDLLKFNKSTISLQQTFYV